MRKSSIMNMMSTVITTRNRKSTMKRETNTIPTIWMCKNIWQHRYHDSMDSPDHDRLDNSDMHQGRHDDDGADDGSDDLNASFEKDTHALTKVKAAIMYNINVERDKHGLSQMYDDITLSAVAMKFAETLKNNDYDERFLNTLLDQHKNDHCRPDQKVDAKFDVAYIKSEYE